MGDCMGRVMVKKYVPKVTAEERRQQERDVVYALPLYGDKLMSFDALHRAINANMIAAGRSRMRRDHLKNTLRRLERRGTVYTEVVQRGWYHYKLYAYSLPF